MESIQQLLKTQPQELPAAPYEPLNGHGSAVDTIGLAVETSEDTGANVSNLEPLSPGPSASSGAVPLSTPLRLRVEGSNIPVVKRTPGRSATMPARSPMRDDTPPVLAANDLVATQQKLEDSIQQPEDSLENTQPINSADAQSSTPEVCQEFGLCAQQSQALTLTIPFQTSTPSFDERMQARRREYRDRFSHLVSRNSTAVYYPVRSSHLHSSQPQPSPPNGAHHAHATPAPSAPPLSPLPVSVDDEPEVAKAAVSHPVEDATETLAHMVEALDALAAPAVLQSETSATLQWLRRVSMDSPSAAWVQHFDSVLNAVLELMVDPEPLVREQALRVLAELLKNQVRKN